MATSRVSKRPGTSPCLGQSQVQGDPTLDSRALQWLDAPQIECSKYTRPVRGRRGRMPRPLIGARDAICNQFFCHPMDEGGWGCCRLVESHDGLAPWSWTDPLCLSTMRTKTVWSPISSLLIFPIRLIPPPPPERSVPLTLCCDSSKLHLGPPPRNTTHRQSALSRPASQTQLDETRYDLDLCTGPFSDVSTRP